MIELFFLLVTIFFIFKLREAFGTRDEEEKVRQKAIEEFFKQKITENMKDLNASINKSGGLSSLSVGDSISKDSQNNDYNLGFEINDDIKEALDTINFDKAKFLKGAENAVEIVNEAFSNKDLDTLNELLSKSSFDNFKKQIEQLKSENKNLKSHLISILLKEIKGIKIEKNKLIIDVFFEMEQINFIENEKGEVVFGNKKQIDKVKEIWSFSKDIKSNLNFWTVENINGDI